MYALFTELDIPAGTPTAGAPEGLRRNAIPQVREAGATGAYWLEAMNGRAMGVILFDDEAKARAAAAGLTVGGRPKDAPEGVAFRTIEVREVIAHL
ncbi:MAG TPA: hypothetical protein VFJ17_11435 [Mycobacteriales bacterium]|jgi:hypothetical protein|nr:hypothetical protein [Mycobacteriales bacterium]